MTRNNLKVWLEYEIGIRKKFKKNNNKKKLNNLN